MRTGVVILCIFAAVWAGAGILVQPLPTGWIALPLAISTAVLIYASRQRTEPPPPHVGRLVGIWSAVEGIAMFVAADMLINAHRSDALMPVFAIIVGLHFLPLARGIPVRLYYGTGAALITLGVAGLMVPQALRALIVGGTAPVILWASAVAMVRRVR